MLIAITIDEYVGKRCKGTKKSVTNQDITFDNYRDCLLNDETFEHIQKHSDPNSIR